MRDTLAIPHDFDAFWNEVVAGVEGEDPAPLKEPDASWTDSGLQVERVTLRGVGGVRFYGWLLRPMAAAVHGALLHLPGYSATMYDPLRMGINAQIARSGFLVFAIDPRGQGASRAGALLASEGKLLTGIHSPREHILRGIVADCVQATRYLCGAAGFDRIGVMGNSQGGGLALMTASLLPERVGAVTAMLPFLTHYRFQVECRPKTGPYQEIVRYLDLRPQERESVLHVLSYFDTLSHAARVRAPALLSAGLADTTCPAPSIVALHDRLPGLKSLITFPHMGHVNSPEFYPHVVAWMRHYLSAGIGKVQVGE